MFEKISGKKIKEAIKSAGLTQTDIAEILNSKQSYVSQLINETTNISEKTLKKIAAATGKPLTFFIDDNNSAKNNNSNNQNHDIEVLKEKVAKLEAKVELLEMKIKS